MLLWSGRKKFAQSLWKHMPKPRFSTAHTLFFLRATSFCISTKKLFKLYKITCLECAPLMSRAGRSWHRRSSFQSKSALHSPVGAEKTLVSSWTRVALFLLLKRHLQFQRQFATYLHA